MESFDKIWKAVKIMRKEKNADVDLYGCEALSKKNGKTAFSKRFIALISLILSSQTRDTETAKAICNLVEYGCTPTKLFHATTSKMMSLIKSVGFYKKKAVYLKQLSKYCLDNGDIPKDYESLVSLKGVGRKIAILAMQICWNKTEGISVDTHVHRIMNRIGLVNTKKPDQTAIDLEDCVPKKYWKELNPLFVGFGQKFCKPRNPSCSNCKAKQYCKYYLENN